MSQHGQLALILPISGGYPDQGLPPGSPGAPDQGLPPGSPGSPSHPIELPPLPPGVPSHPITLPPSGGIPSHPIFIPGAPDQGLPGDGESPGKPDQGLPPGSSGSPGVPSHPIALPPGTVWPPLNPGDGVVGKGWLLVIVLGADGKHKAKWIFIDTTPPVAAPK